MKNFLAKLIGWREQRSGADKFHEQEKIERELARERGEEAAIWARERARGRGESIVEIPSEEQILGPSDSMEKK